MTGGKRQANGGMERGGGSRVDGTNAQPGYHINLAAYKFALDRVKPLQAAGRGRCKRGVTRRGRRTAEEGVVSHPQALRAAYYPLSYVTEFCGCLRTATAAQRIARRSRNHEIEKSFRASGLRRAGTRERRDGNLINGTGIVPCVASVENR